MWTLLCPAVLFTQTWSGKQENWDAAQKILVALAKANSEAQLGQFKGPHPVPGKALGPQLPVALATVSHLAAQQMLTAAAGCQRCHLPVTTPAAVLMAGRVASVVLGCRKAAVEHASFLNNSLCLLCHVGACYCCCRWWPHPAGPAHWWCRQVSSHNKQQQRSGWQQQPWLRHHCQWHWFCLGICLVVVSDALWLAVTYGCSRKCFVVCESVRQVEGAYRLMW
jgi:hypothetical protein